MMIRESRTDCSVMTVIGDIAAPVSVGLRAVGVPIYVGRSTRLNC